MGFARHASRRALATATGLAVALGFGLAGCGSDDKPDPGSAEGGLNGRIETADKRAKSAPTDPKPLAELVKLHFQLATLKRDGGGFSEQGRSELREAAQTWERYLALDPEPVDTSVAQLMSAAYGPGALDDPRRAVEVQQVLADNTSPPRAGAYVQLATMAYSAGELETGDRAAKRAVELSRPERRKKLRKRLATARTQLAPQP